MTTLTNIIGSEKGNQGRDNLSDSDNNPILLAAEVTKRLIAEAQHQKLEEKLHGKKPEIIIPAETPMPSLPLEKKIDYIYLPESKLYISEERFHQNTSWSKTQKILHSKGKRMPTLPEYIEFVNYLQENVNNPKVAKIPNAQLTLAEINELPHSEWFDATFGFRQSAASVKFHSFDVNGKIVSKEEVLEDYLSCDLFPRINMEAWLINTTKQGLPKKQVLPFPISKAGILGYLGPELDKVAAYSFDSGPGRVLSLQEDPEACIQNRGVRYVSLTPD